MTKELVPVQVIENKIFVIRDQRVMLDSDLALLYEVETKRVNEAVKRNIDRFPEDFMFQLNDNEWNILRSQFATFDKVIRKYKPYVFTEHGVLMLSSVLNSKRAIAVNIQIMRVFTKLREMALTNKDLSQRVDEFERTLISYARENNTNIEEIFRQLEYLTDLTKPKKIGFKTID
jgi:hypothetical protein